MLGYEDLYDHDRLRLDPVHALLAGKEDITGEQRVLERDKGYGLAGRSTLNRLELGGCGRDGRYHKIEPQPAQIEALLIAEGVKAIPRKSREIVLDFDATDDPLHGRQQGAYFRGYYKSYCYLPLYCFCGNIPLWAQLRDCKRDASKGTVAALEKIVPVIRRRFGPAVRIIVRAASGFARNPKGGIDAGRDLRTVARADRSGRAEDTRSTVRGVRLPHAKQLEPFPSHGG